MCRIRGAVEAVPWELTGVHAAAAIGAGPSSTATLAARATGAGPRLLDRARLRDSWVYLDCDDDSGASGS